MNRAMPTITESADELKGLLFSVMGLILIVYQIQDVYQKGFFSWSNFIPLLIFTVVVILSTRRISQISQTTYLLLSEGGIEYRSGDRVVLCPWNEVVKLIERPSPTLIVSVGGRSYMRYMITKNANDDPHIPLYLFYYSPNSELAKDLRKYAPHLFESE